MFAAVLHYIAGLTGGAAATLQAALASLMGQRTGSMASVFIIHLGGTLLAGALLLGLRGENIAGWRNVPWYALGAGSLGVLLLSCINYAIPRLGVGATITLFVTAQLLVGAFLDHFGLLGSMLRPVDLPRALGIVALLTGTWLIVR